MSHPEPGFAAAHEHGMIINQDAPCKPMFRLGQRVSHARYGSGVISYVGHSRACGMIPPDYTDRWSIPDYHVRLPTGIEYYTTYADIRALD